MDQAPGSVVGHVSGADLDLVEDAAQAIALQRRAFRADQFNLRSSVLAHEVHTGPEILAATAGNVDVFVDFVGSGGSFTGVSRAFKAANPAIRCYLLEPVGAAHLAGGPITRAEHRIQGGGYCRDLPLLERDLVDGWLQVDDERAADCCRRLARVEGLFAGFSSGAVVSAALELLQGPERGATIVVLLADSGLKYLSTDLYP